MKRKMYISLVLLLIGIIPGFGQEKRISYSIEGKIEGLSSGKIYLSVFSSSGERDSSIVQNGAFRFRGTLREPSPVILCLEPNYVNRPLFMFFVDNGEHKVTLVKDRLKDGKASGTATTKDYEVLQALERPVDDEFSALMDVVNGDTQQEQQMFEEKRLALWERKRDIYRSFIKANPSSPVATWATYRFFSSDPSLADELEQLYNVLSPAYLYTSYGQEVKKAVEINNMLAIGTIAPNFTQKDTIGNPVSLEDFRGKYVLLDFWASWCLPCRKDNPFIVRAYNAYKNKGFTVLGVSLDRPGKKDAWMKAIHDDGLTWTHVSDLQFWNNAVAKLYGIKAVPANFLIGPNGKIIAKNLHGAELEEVLGKFMK